MCREREIWLRREEREERRERQTGRVGDAYKGWGWRLISCAYLSSTEHGRVNREREDPLGDRPKAVSRHRLRGVEFAL